MRPAFLVLLLSLPCFCFSFSAPKEAGAYVVLDAKTGKVLDEKAMDEPMYPASCTKLATLLYILHTSPDIDLSARVVVPKVAVQTVPSSVKAKNNWNTSPSYLLESDGSSLGLVAGEIVTVRDLLYGMMVSSGNDAANTLAYYWGGRSIDGFVTNMNSFVQTLGATKTHFCNPHGLHHPNHVASAYDLAILTKQALQQPLFREIVKTAVYVKPKTNKQRLPQTWKTTNKLLKRGSYSLKECIGVKTGWHSRAQKCLVAAAENEKRSIIVVLLKHPDMTLIFKDAKNMLNSYLKEPLIEKELVSSGNLLLTYHVPGSSQAIGVQASQAPFHVSYYLSEKPEFEAKAVWKKCFPPLTEKDEVGVLEIYRDKERIASLPLVPVVAVPSTLSSRIAELEYWFISHPEATGVLLLLALALAASVGYRFLKKKR